MIVLGKLAQGHKEVRRQDQDEQADIERDRLIAGAQPDETEQVEPDINRDHGDGDGTEEFQHGRGQKRDAQHAHRTASELVGNTGDGFKLAPGLAKQFQCCQPLKPVEEMTAHPGQSLKLALVGGGGAHADDGHEQGNQGCRAQQDHADDPVDRKYRRQHRQRDQHGKHHLGQETGEIAFQCLDLFDHHTGQLATVTFAGKAWAQGGDMGEDVLA